MVTLSTGPRSLLFKSRDKWDTLGAAAPQKITVPLCILPTETQMCKCRTLLPSFLTALTKAALNGFVINSTSPSLLQTLQWSEQVCAATESWKQHIAKAKTGNTQCSPATVSTGPVSPGKGQTKSCLCKWPGPWISEHPQTSDSQFHPL